MEPKSINELWGLPLRKARKKVWFFDRSGVCCVLSLDEFLKQYHARLRDIHKDSTNLNYYGADVSGDDVFWIKCSEYTTNPDTRHLSLILATAGTYLEPGDTLEDYFRYIDECREWYNYVYYRKRVDGRVRELPEGVSRFVTKIDRPNFIRYPENSAKNTFDMIKLDVYTVTVWDEDKLKYFKHHMKDIYTMVLDKLTTSKSFLRYNVPVGCLALTDVFYVGGDCYEFVFELKQELLNLELQAQ